MRKTIIAGSMTSFYSTTIIKNMEIVTENPIQNHHENLEFKVNLTAVSVQ